jgi:hypothetical protein
MNLNQIKSYRIVFDHKGVNESYANKKRKTHFGELKIFTKNSYD